MYYSSQFGKGICACTIPFKTLHYIKHVQKMPGLTTAGNGQYTFQHTVHYSMLGTVMYTRKQKEPGIGKHLELHTER